MIVLTIIALLTASAPARAQCAAPPADAGRVVYDSGSSTLSYCDGTDWRAFPKGPASCAGIGSWESITAYDSLQLTDVIFVNGMFYAAAAGGSGAPGGGVYRSADGRTWEKSLSTTPPHNPATFAANNIAYGNGIFVAVSNVWGSTTAVSSDGIHWDSNPAGIPNEHWSKLIYGDGTFVTITDGGTNRIMTTSDGVNWTPHNVGNLGIRTGAYGNGRFVLFPQYGWDDGHVLVSTDAGASWQEIPRTGVLNFHDLGAAIYHDGEFITMYWGSTHRSADGIHWTETADPINVGDWRLAYGNGLFVAVPADWSPSNHYMTATDTANWSPHTTTAFNRSFSNIAYGNNRFVAVGHDGAGRIAIGHCGGTECADPQAPAGEIRFNSTNRVLQWCDGSSWHAAGPVNPGGPNAGCANPPADAGAIVFNSTSCVPQYCDGDTWRALGPLNPGAC